MNPVFAAIDTISTPVAAPLVGALAGAVGGIKLGLEFFCANGPQGIRTVMSGAAGLPLFLVMFACVLTGTLLGGLVTWLAGAPQRRQARLHVRELKRVQGAAPAPAAPAAAATATASTAVQAPAA
jgi:orotidine-5'-phosphate decarboxylase